MTDRSHQSGHSISREKWNLLVHVTGLSSMHATFRHGWIQVLQHQGSLSLHLMSNIFTKRTNKLLSVEEILKKKKKDSPTGPHVYPTSNSKNTSLFSSALEQKG